MSTKKTTQLLEERGKLLSELSTLSHILHGSWVERYSVCSRPNCKCHQGKRHGPRYYLVINENGRQRQKYISNAQVEAAREGVAQYKRALMLVDRITQINMELIKERVYGEE
ncbi:MAG: hypothetical protein EOM12_15195 [Verrucomicrobiae bacterium]|nr:hypothetical protein [Verrucomicrobiae bacterium]